MDTPTLVCQNEKRRYDVRTMNQLNGLDYLQVEEKFQRNLKCYLIQKASSELIQIFTPPNDNAKKHIVIEGGRRIQDIKVAEKPILHQSPEPDEDDYLEIVVDKPGDFSLYTLRLAALDESGQPTSNPMPGIDRRYDRLEFSFKQGCSSDLDCKFPAICPPQKLVQPEINYLAKDYASFRQLIIDRLSQIMPGWKERHIPDIGITMTEILAYVGDYLSYYQDAVATEAYLNTARQRISVRRHSRLVDYPMHEGCNARTWIFVHASDDVSLKPEDIFFVTRINSTFEKGKILSTNDLLDVPFRDYEVFEPLAGNPYFYTAHNEIRIYTWGDSECCLPQGAITATLQDEWIYPIISPGQADADQQIMQQNLTADQSPVRKLHLKEGDVLIFEEILGPKTGDPADADPSHRHAVRLTKVTPRIDELYNQPIIDIQWSEEDQLPFPLCISAIGRAPECALLENISIARANIVLADHRRSVGPELVGTVGIKKQSLKCRGEGRLADAMLLPERFPPNDHRLEKSPLTFSEPLLEDWTASEVLKQDPANAVAQIELKCTSALPGRDPVETQWTVQRDLLRSDREDAHFVVEMDNEGHAHLRFGDGESGQLPEVGEMFDATYRVGIGPSGNIGAEAISHIVLRTGRMEGIQLFPCNPIAAQGGIAPEPLSEIKLFAPTAFRKRLERAITADDYRRLAERHPKLQRAAATLRWTGSWYKVLVVIDPLGKAEEEQGLLDEIANYLNRFRRMGHDLVVKNAQYVPLDIVMEVCVSSSYLRGHVKSALLEVLSNKILPNGQVGFFHPDNLSFGDAIRLSRLIATAQPLPGVSSVKVTKFERLFEGDHGELSNGILALDLLEIARLDNDPSLPENGRLELILKGGR